jgi:hypothetical protein
MISLLFLVALLPAADEHAKANPLYQQLREKGVAVSEKTYAQLPAPEMPDGLSAAEQKKVIEKLLGDDIDYERFVESSVNAPTLLRPLRQVPGADPKVPAQEMNLYFIVHGNLNKLRNRKTLEELVGQEQRKGEGKELTAADLKARGITIAPGAEKHEGYGHAVINLLDRIKLEVTGHSYHSEHDGSILLAAEVDPRFARDREFPNRWRPLKTEETPAPYGGAAYYLKVTPLKGVQGTSFVECHLVFTEPFGWFQGENLLRSKLPAATTTMVRKFRAKLNRQEP